MKHIFILLFLLPVCSKAQIYPSGFSLDSVTFTFHNGDSLAHHMRNSAYYYPVTTITIDTFAATLWQIGNTVKPIFSNDTIPQSGIMTDTIHPYPRNANSSFLLKIDHELPNFIVDIWHKYETDSLHAGGIVEYSTDTGATWINIANCPVITQVNFYTSLDTLMSGYAAFMGNSHGERLSRLQVINCWAFKTTATDCFMRDNAPDGLPFYLRFRFVSDSTTDSLSGWMIDSIKIENPGCIPGFVPMINEHETLSVSPNPTANELIIKTSNTHPYTISIINMLGQTVRTLISDKQEVTMAVDKVPAGIYTLVLTNDNGVRINTKVVINH